MYALTSSLRRFWRWVRSWRNPIALIEADLRDPGPAFNDVIFSTLESSRVVPPFVARFDAASWAARPHEVECPWMRVLKWLRRKGGRLKAELTTGGRNRGRYTAHARLLVNGAIEIEYVPASDGNVGATPPIRSEPDGLAGAGR